MQNYEIQEKIYESKTTIIHKVRNLKDNNIYAMKEFVGFFNQSLNEIQLLKSCQIPFVIKLKEVFRVDENVVMIMEYADQRSLKQFINEHLGNSIQERVICKILIQLVFVLIYMRENKICYKGLNPENILIHQDQIRICDFGIDNLIQNQKPSYRPPELLFHNKFTYKSMMYQLGLVLYELTMQRSLFQFDTVDQVKSVIQNGGAIVKIPPMYSRQLRFIISTCLEISENDRLDIRQLVLNENFKVLLKQKHFTFTHDQQDTFDFWCNSKQLKEKRRSICTPNVEVENPKTVDKNSVLPNDINVNKAMELIKSKGKQHIPKLNLKKPHDELLTLRPISQQSKLTQSANLIKTNAFSKSNFAFSTHRKIKSPPPKNQWIDFMQKPQYLDAPIKPQTIINNLIQLKMQQCVETIGIDETRFNLNRLRQGGSVNEFLSKYQDAKHQCIARHLQDIISFTQI